MELWSIGVLERTVLKTIQWTMIVKESLNPEPDTWKTITGFFLITPIFRYSSTPD